MIGNLAINLVLYVLVSLFMYPFDRSGSLQYLWGMINTLQLIVHVPLFTLWFPANAAYMYSFIITISNFNIIPDGITEKVYSVFSSDDETYSSQFELLDIFEL